MEEKQEFFRGQIYYVKFPDTGSYVESKTRPAVVISNDVHNKFSKTLIVVPITTKIKDYPTHVDIETPNGVYGQILCENITTVDKSWVVDYKDVLSEKQLKELDRTIILELQLGGKERFDYELQLKKVKEAKKAFELEVEKLKILQKKSNSNTKIEEKSFDKKAFIEEYRVSKNKTETAKKWGFSSLQVASTFYSRNKDKV